MIYTPETPELILNRKTGPGTLRKKNLVGLNCIEINLDVVL